MREHRKHGVIAEHAQHPPFAAGLRVSCLGCGVGGGRCGAKGGDCVVVEPAIHICDDGL